MKNESYHNLQQTQLHAMSVHEEIFGGLECAVYGSEPQRAA